MFKASNIWFKPERSMSRVLLVLAVTPALGLLPVQRRLTRRCAPLRAADGNSDDYWVEYRDGQECIVSDMGASCMERANLPDKSPGFVAFTPWEDFRKPYEPRAAAAAPEVPPVPSPPSLIPSPTASEPPKTPAEARARARVQAISREESPLPIHAPAARDVAAPAARKRMALRASGSTKMDTGFPKFPGNNRPRF